MRPRKHFRAKQRLLRIAQIAPLHENVSPHSYRGTQRIIAHLCQELARRGHEVTLFASYDSSARARLAPVDSNSLRASGAPRDGPERQLPVLCDVYENAGRFDMIHSDVGFRDFPLRRSSSAPTLSTMHNRLERTDLTRACQRYCDLPLVSISDRQREPLPDMNWIATVYHGLPADSYTFNPTVGAYLAFWGPFAPQQ